MGRVEMLILAGAIAILGRFSLSVNDALASNETHVLQSGYELTAVSLAEGIFHEVWLKAFDANIVASFPTSIPSAFTAANQLGAEAGETYPNYNDIDDYDNLLIAGTSNNGMTYTLSARVGYVNTTDKETYLATQSTLKRLDITVTSDYLRNDIILSRIFPYWR